MVSLRKSWNRYCLVTSHDTIWSAECGLYNWPQNDFYDREIDAINEPYWPILSGAISIPQVVTQIVFLLLAGVGLSYLLDISAGHQFPIITILCLFGAFLAYIYSAQPLKLKQNGWFG